MRCMHFLQKHAGLIIFASLMCALMLSVHGVMAEDSAWDQALSIVNSQNLVTNPAGLYQAIFPVIIVGDLIAYAMTNDDRTKAILKKCIISAIIVWVIFTCWDVLVVNTINDDIIPASTASN